MMSKHEQEVLKFLAKMDPQRYAALTEDDWKKHCESTLNSALTVEELKKKVDEARANDGEEEDIEVKNWPDPPAGEAFSGLVGEFTRLWEPHTEASPISLAAQFLVFYGHAIGRSPYFVIGGDDHNTNLELALVGPTSFARKGQSYGCVRRTFEKVQLSLGVPIVEARGLSSGEGLIHAVRDERFEPNKKGGAPVKVDEGVQDKRLLVFESEFASVLRRMKREGNTLSELMRQVWDSGNLGTMTRNAPLRATNAHVSIITHVTPPDLQTYLSWEATMNGFANRFIFLATKRVRVLPSPGRPSDKSLAEFAAKLARSIEFGTCVGEMRRSIEAEEAWKKIYERLTKPRTGRQHNALIARATPHVLRLSMIYALLDSSAMIETRHQESALALWEYAERTSKYVFGDSVGDKVAEKILELLREAGEIGLLTSELRAKIGAKKHLREGLLLLIENEQVTGSKTPPRAAGGRTGQRWFAV
jgi:hypothetical protein